jgi:hypothetical protein
MEALKARHRKAQGSWPEFHCYQFNCYMPLVWRIFRVDVAAPARLSFSSTNPRRTLYTW